MNLFLRLIVFLTCFVVVLAVVDSRLDQAIRYAAYREAYSFSMTCRAAKPTYCGDIPSLTDFLK